MMKTLLLSFLALVLTVPSVLAQDTLGFEDDWSGVLRRIVQNDGLVAYDEAAGADFDRTLAAVETFDPSRLTTDDEKLAFWINAYNVKMVEAIAARPDARNLETQNLFDELFKSPVTVAGLQATLDQIEHVILRRQDGPAALRALAVEEVTPLIHVGLNCAAVSCPRLRREAFQPHQVREQLGEQMCAWMGSVLQAEWGADGTVYLSSLLDWFGEDFDEPTGKAGDYLLEWAQKRNEERLRAEEARRPEGVLRCGTPSPTLGAMHKLFKGRTAAEIKALPNVRFAYDWTVARAE